MELVPCTKVKLDRKFCGMTSGKNSLIKDQDIWKKFMFQCMIL